MQCNIPIYRNTKFKFRHAKRAAFPTFLSGARRTPSEPVTACDQRAPDGARRVDLVEHAAQTPRLRAALTAWACHPCLALAVFARGSGPDLLDLVEHALQRGAHRVHLAVDPSAATEQQAGIVTQVIQPAPDAAWGHTKGRRRESADVPAGPRTQGAVDEHQASARRGRWRKNFGHDERLSPAATHRTRQR